MFYKFPGVLCCCTLSGNKDIVMGQKTERLGLSLLSSAVRCPLTVDKFLNFRVSIEQAGNALGKVGHQILSQLPST